MAVRSMTTARDSWLVDSVKPLIFAVVMLSPAMLLAQNPEPVPLAQVEQGVAWTEVIGEPLWWQKPVPKTDRFSFRTKCLGRKVWRAQRTLTGGAQQTLRDLLFDHLQPVLGNVGTLPVLEEMLQQTVLVDAVVGNVQIGSAEDEQLLSAACMSWRTPIRSVVEKFDPSMQGRIEWVLLRSIVHWEITEESPAWARKLPQREGYVRIAFACPGHSPKNAMLSSTSGGRANVHAHLVDLLTPVVGVAAASKAASAAVARLAPVAKVCVDARNRQVKLKKGAKPKRGPKCTAYCMWEVPTGPLLRTLPKAMRAAALAALSPK